MSKDDGLGYGMRETEAESSSGQNTRAGKSRAFVIAHFHPKGAISIGLRNLVSVFLSYSQSVVFVTTNAARDQVASLPHAVRVIERPNVGYDFYSYKLGIESLGDVSNLDQLIVLNSSFVCFDPVKLCEAFFSRSRPEIDLLGLSSSKEIEFHLQSYFISFENKELINSSAFGAWWGAMEPISARAEVIAKYEIGMSRYFLDKGYRLAPAFSPSAPQKFRALWRSFEFSGRFPDVSPDGTVTLDPAMADVLNPTHFLWDFLLNEFAVAKIELLKRNPFAMDLRKLMAVYQSNIELKRIVDDALQE